MPTNSDRMTVEVIQYKFPDGHAVLQTTEIGSGCQSAYAAMRQSGANLAAECAAGMVTLYIEDRHRGRDIACELVANGPEIQRAIEKMLREHYGVPDANQ